MRAIHNHHNITFTNSSSPLLYFARNTHFLILSLFFFLPPLLCLCEMKLKLCVLFSLLLVASAVAQQQAAFSFYEYFQGHLFLLPVLSLLCWCSLFLCVHREWDVQRAVVSMKTNEQSLGI